MPWLFRITLRSQFVLKKTWRNWVTRWSNYFITFFSREYWNRWMTKKWEMGKVFTLLGIHLITRRTVQKRRGTWYDKSPTSKLYTTWAHILSDRNVFCTPRGGGGKQRGTIPQGAFLVSSLFIIIIFLFFAVTCPRLPVFARLDKYSPLLPLHRLGLVSRVTLISFTPRGEGEQQRGLMPLDLFLLPRRDGGV